MKIIEFDKWVKNMNANIMKFNQNKNVVDVFDSNDMIEKWRKIHSINKIIN